MTKSIKIYENCDEVTTIWLVHTSIHLESLKTLSHDVGKIQCSVKGLIHKNICLQVQKLTLALSMV